MENKEDLLGIKEVAEKTGYSERTIRDYCIKGKINAHKLTDRSRKWLIPVRELSIFPKRDLAVEGIGGNDSIVDVVTPGEEAKEQLANTLRKHDYNRELIETVTSLLGYLIDTEVNKPTKDQFQELKYKIWTDGYGYGVTNKQLSDRLKSNKEYFLASPTLTREFNNLICHLRNEDSLIAGEGFDVISERFPYLVINLLRELIRKMTFKGTCPECEEFNE